MTVSEVQQLDVEHLLHELTLDEKISLLAGIDFWHTAAIDRLDIPSVRVSDGPNGVRGTKFFDSVPSNCFPCGTGMAATFNKDLLHEAGQLMGKEAKLKGAHCILGPTCNIARGPLGGRAFESYSEDPLLSGHAASQVIQGIQSEKVLACIKHFVCNDQEDRRIAVDTIVTDRALREIYLKPFQIAFRDAQPKSLMTAYNKVNGEHVSQSKKLLQDILRGEWGFDGMTMSDWYGTYSMKEALDAGLNLEMPGGPRFRTPFPLAHKVNSNEIHEDSLDNNVRYVLKFVNEALKVGIPKDVVESPNNSPEASELLRRVGGESIVLLKNDNGILPLSKTASAGNEKIAVIGPNAKVTQDSGGGSASLTARYKVTPFDGIQNKLTEGNNTVSLEYALGAFLDKSLPDVGELLVNENGKKGITGKFYKNPPGSKNREFFESIDLLSTRIFMSDFKSKYIPVEQTLFYADFLGDFTPEETGTYEFGCSTMGTAQIFVNDKLIVDNKTHQVKGDAFFLGMGTREEKASIELEKGVTYKIKVEFGTGPTYTLHTEQAEKGGVYFGLRIVSTPEKEIQKAVDLAKKVDKVILCVGISKEWESEGFDRPDMDIPGYTDQLIEAVVKANPNVVVVNQSGSPVTMPWVEQVPALVQAWYGGNEAGNSIADVLFGDINPSGKLSLTFPRRIEDNPAYLNFGSTNGRVLYGEDVFVGYRYYEKIKRDVLFPFGYGLSYTSFEFGDLNVQANDDTLKVLVKVTNTGKIDGAESVQLYVQHVNPSVIRPVKELKDFEKVFLKAGESKAVHLELSVREATSFWNTYKSKWQSEKGTYNVLVGNSSDNATLKGEFETTKTVHWLGL
ncbi:glycoside hydrolase family 3 protein [Suhomyces tanzawaensis NRRL Y-17324]|uniref:beta-glucosidase n=1 Tax=Suhomyces tanzawaensis NRRL Y-17324 TaxID=984487 RepID=A0A1E4SBH6_9ASCO|nr:glycoside hydrolase family 3 protein [Suhomyces tanzawaensis NRRL Y-17324]ODV76849.1 glycoside hydrolase family 3 protein [Suhomyces tanzawaensis NRRL Y-17324]